MQLICDKAVPRAVTREEHDESLMKKWSIYLYTRRLGVK
jgi:hypothetical protein